MLLSYIIKPSDNVQEDSLCVVLPTASPVWVVGPSMLNPRDGCATILRLGDGRYWIAGTDSST